jgi:hypothetical protein
MELKLVFIIPKVTFLIIGIETGKYLHLYLHLSKINVPCGG